jgi:hypothetical protein
MISRNKTWSNQEKTRDKRIYPCCLSDDVELVGYVENLVCISQPKNIGWKTKSVSEWDFVLLSPEKQHIPKRPTVELVQCVSHSLWWDMKCSNLGSSLEMTGNYDNDNN